MEIFNSSELKALAFAEERHAKQTYNGGSYYENHILPVTNLTFDLGGSQIHKILAAIHDTVEDEVATLGEIQERFGNLIAYHVHTLTRFKNEETYEEYIERVAGNPTATFVKLADLAVNTATCRGGSKEALLERYRAATLRLRFGKKN